MSTNQSQLSLEEQLKEVVILANKDGLYDAADYIQNIIKGDK